MRKQIYDEKECLRTLGKMEDLRDRILRRESKRKVLRDDPVPAYPVKPESMRISQRSYPQKVSPNNKWSDYGSSDNWKRLVTCLDVNMMGCEELILVLKHYCDIDYIQKGGGPRKILLPQIGVLKRELTTWKKYSQYTTSSSSDDKLRQKWMVGWMGYGCTVNTTVAFDDTDSRGQGRRSQIAHIISFRMFYDEDNDTVKIYGGYKANGYGNTNDQVDRRKDSDVGIQTIYIR